MSRTCAKSKIKVPCTLHPLPSLPFHRCRYKHSLAHIYVNTPGKRKFIDFGLHSAHISYIMGCLIHEYILLKVFRFENCVTSVYDKFSMLLLCAAWMRWKLIFVLLFSEVRVAWGFYKIGGSDFLFFIAHTVFSFSFFKFVYAYNSWSTDFV